MARIGISSKKPVQIYGPAADDLNLYSTGATDNILEYRTFKGLQIPQWTVATSRSIVELKEETGVISNEQFINVNDVSIRINNTSLSSLVDDINNANISNIRAELQRIEQGWVFRIVNTAGGPIKLSNVGTGNILQELGYDANHPDGSSFWAEIPIQTYNEEILLSNNAYYTTLASDFLYGDTSISLDDATPISYPPASYINSIPFSTVGKSGDIVLVIDEGTPEEVTSSTISITNTDTPSDVANAIETALSSNGITTRLSDDNTFFRIESQTGGKFIVRDNTTSDDIVRRLFRLAKDVGSGQYEIDAERHVNNQPGIVWINDERIEYWYLNKTANVIRNFKRGARGTSKSHTTNVTTSTFDGDGSTSSFTITSPLTSSTGQPIARASVGIEYKVQPGELEQGTWNLPIPYNEDYVYNVTHYKPRHLYVLGKNDYIRTDNEILTTTLVIDGNNIVLTPTSGSRTSLDQIAQDINNAAIGVTATISDGEKKNAKSVIESYNPTHWLKLYNAIDNETTGLSVTETGTITYPAKRISTGSNISPYFDGSSYFTIGNASTWNGAFSEKSWSFYIEPDSDYQTSKIYEQASGTNGVTIWLHNGVLNASAFISSGGTTINVRSDRLLFKNNNYHITLTYSVDQDQFNLYVNNILEDSVSTSSTGTIPDHQTSITLGSIQTAPVAGYYTGVTNNFSGYITNFTVWDDFIIPNNTIRDLSLERFVSVSVGGDKLILTPVDNEISIGDNNGFTLTTFDQTRAGGGTASFPFIWIIDSRNENINDLIEPFVNYNESRQVRVKRTYNLVEGTDYVIDEAGNQISLTNLEGNPAPGDIISIFAKPTFSISGTTLSFDDVPINGSKIVYQGFLGNSWDNLTSTTVVYPSGTVVHNKEQIPEGIGESYQHYNRLHTTSRAAGVLIRQNPSLSKNSISNPYGRGARIGTIGSDAIVPTGWTITNSANITYDLDNFTFYNGIQGFEFSTSGTSAGSEFATIDFEQEETIEAVNGDTFNFSINFELQSGSLASVNDVALELRYYNSSNTFLSSDTLTISNVDTRNWEDRFTFTQTISEVTTAYVVPRFYINAESGESATATFRIGKPVLERERFNIL